MKRTTTLVLSLLVCLVSFSQNTIFSTGFEGPGFDAGWTIGMTTSIDETPYDYPGGLDPWEMWAISDGSQGYYVHSGDSAAFIGGTSILENQYDWLMSPQFAVPANATTNVTYWMWYQSSTPSYWTWLYIMVYDVGDDKWEIGELILYEENVALHYIEEYSFDLSPWEGKDVKVAFVKRGTYQFAMDDIKCISVNGLNATEFNSPDIKAYPNPVSDILFLENLSEVQSVKIIDMLGRELTQQVEGTTNRVAVDFSTFESGLYLIKINSKSKDYNTFLIQKR